MATGAVRGRLNARLDWHLADVVETITETPRHRTLVLRVPDWPGHLAGQHIDIRLTAEDGYQAQRSYSISAPADGERVELLIELVGDGEVSPYLIDEVVVGDKVEVRGPIGGYFVWAARLTAPLLLVAGGSGIAPLRAIARARRGTGTPTRLLYSARMPAEAPYLAEMDRMGAADDPGGAGFAVTYTWTRAPDTDRPGYRRRVDAAMLAEVGWPPEQSPLIYVCGPTPFVEEVADDLVDAGHLPARIRAERFGPSGI